jgi:ATP-binding cassette subfamily G (WHITE) protein 2 (PDR)
MADRIVSGDEKERTGEEPFVMEEADRLELQEIITVLSQQRESVLGPPTGIDSLAGMDDPALDPMHKDFQIAKWLKNFIDQFHEVGLDPKHMGLVYKNLNVSGSQPALQLQGTVGTLLTSPLRIGQLFSSGKKEPKRILRNFDGILQSGEMLIVLGRPGAGCSTLLKTMCGELHGLEIDHSSTIHYDGISQKQMMKEFKGETIYNQEIDKHFPHLTVGQTLQFAASMRTPSHRVQNMSREEYCKHTAKVIMAVCGLSHTYNTKVGDDYVRGVSGGERKRVSIAEMILAGSPFGAWDNSTRGLDSATALKFLQSLRLASDTGGLTSAVAIYQASQDMYDLFDKTAVLYDGRQIYFGPARSAKSFFERQGWICPARQTTGDFLTSITNPLERKARPEMEKMVPRTPDDFEKHWRESPEFGALQTEIGQYENEYPSDQDGKAIAELRQQQQLRKAKHVRLGSPYLISIPMQIRLNTKRAFQRRWNDISATLTSAIMNLVMALVIGSIFFGQADGTAAFYSKGSVIFIGVLLNALTAISEINGLYAQRPIVEKQASYAFYHPATEAAAGIFADIPIKFFIAVFFNLVLYFMAGLRREPAQFFLFFLITYMCTFVMSGIFRTMAALTKTIEQAMAISGVLVLALVIYTGFVISPPQMHPWFAWIRWINPLYYAFELLIASEFHARDFPCSAIVPPFSPPVGDSWICGVVGAVAGEYTVNGDAFIAANYSYYYSHVWRNFGILIAFLIFFMFTYMVAAELNSSTSSTAEVLVYPHGQVPTHLKKGLGQAPSDEEAVAGVEARPETQDENMKALEPQTDLFTWRNVVYDIDIKGETRRLLDNVSGWVKPGTLTALMGVSGAGKTTLLDVLAQRTSIGVITGDMFVNGKPLDPSFQRKTGYVQQQGKVVIVVGSFHLTLS